MLCCWWNAFDRKSFFTRVSVSTNLWFMRAVLWFFNGTFLLLRFIFMVYLMSRDDFNIPNDVPAIFPSIDGLTAFAMIFCYFSAVTFHQVLNKYSFFVKAICIVLLLETITTTIIGLSVLKEKSSGISSAYFAISVLCIIFNFIFLCYMAGRYWYVGKYNLFLSHSWTRDRDDRLSITHWRVRKIAEKLTEAGKIPWVDDVFIRDGNIINQELINAIVNCDVFVVIVTRMYIEKLMNNDPFEACCFEFYLATQLGKRIEYVQIEENDELLLFYNEFPTLSADSLARQLEQGHQRVLLANAGVNNQHDREQNVNTWFDGNQDELNNWANRRRSLLTGRLASIPLLSDILSASPVCSQPLVADFGYHTNNPEIFPLAAEFGPQNYNDLEVGCLDAIHRKQCFTKKSYIWIVRWIMNILFLLFRFLLLVCFISGEGGHFESPYMNGLAAVFAAIDIVTLIIILRVYRLLLEESLNKHSFFVKSLSIGMLIQVLVTTITSLVVLKVKEVEAMDMYIGVSVACIVMNTIQLIFLAGKYWYIGKYNVYLSHASVDEGVNSRTYFIAQKLKESGFIPWLDAWCLQDPEQSVKERLLAILNSDLFVALVNKQYMDEMTCDYILQLIPFPQAPGHQQLQQTPALAGNTIRLVQAANQTDTFRLEKRNLPNEQNLRLVAENNQANPIRLKLDDQNAFQIQLNNIAYSIQLESLNNENVFHSLRLVSVNNPQTRITLVPATSNNNNPLVVQYGGNDFVLELVSTSRAVPPINADTLTFKTRGVPAYPDNNIKKKCNFEFFLAHKMRKPIHYIVMDDIAAGTTVTDTKSVAFLLTTGCFRNRNQDMLYTSLTNVGVNDEDWYERNKDEFEGLLESLHTSLDVFNVTSPALISDRGPKAKPPAIPRGNANGAGNPAANGNAVNNAAAAVGNNVGNNAGGNQAANQNALNTMNPLQVGNPPGYP